MIKKKENRFGMRILFKVQSLPELVYSMIAPHPSIINSHAISAGIPHLVGLFG
jgi:hypothetical protein